MTTVLTWQDPAGGRLVSLPASVVCVPGRECSLPAGPEL